MIVEGRGVSGSSGHLCNPYDRGSFSCLAAGFSEGKGVDVNIAAPAK